MRTRDHNDSKTCRSVIQRTDSYGHKFILTNAKPLCNLLCVYIRTEDYILDNFSDPGRRQRHAPGTRPDRFRRNADMRSFSRWGSRAAPRLGCRGGVAVWIAVMMPGLLMVLSLGIEAAGWQATQASLQRTADFAAIGGGMNYSAL